MRSEGDRERKREWKRGKQRRDVQERLQGTFLVPNLVKHGEFCDGKH